MDIGKQIIVLNENEKRILDYLVSNYGKKFRIKDLVTILEMPRQRVSVGIHGLEIGLLVIREDELFFRVTNRTMRYFVEESSK